MPFRSDKFILSSRGFSLLEAILSVAVFSLLVGGIVGILFLGSEGGALSGKRARALYLAEEGLEAARSIRNGGFSNLSVGTFGLSTSTSKWAFSGSSDTTDIFTRQVVVSAVDGLRRQVVSTVSWQQNLQRVGSVSLTTRLTNWQALSGRGGMLVFGNNGIPADQIQYRILNADGAWSATSTVSDIDSGSTNKVMRAVRLYSSPTRTEKILLTRHYNGSSQFIYAQVWDGASWSAPVLLSSWALTTFQDVQNFDGAYLSNGDFMAIFADNTVTPKFRVWNGSLWSPVAISARPISGVPVYIVAKARPGTNEVMLATFDSARDTFTQYFNYNGSTYDTASWTIHASHGGTAPLATKRLIDFAWSPVNPLIGTLVFSNNANDRNIRYKTWTANGSGGGSWSTVTNGANQGTSGTRLGVLRVFGRTTTSADFLACSQNTVPQIICYKSTGSPPSITNPTNQIISATTDSGIQQAFDIGFENSSGAYGIAVYSDTTITPKMKKYDPATSVFDVSATSMTALTGSLKTVRAIPQSGADDIMFLMGDSALRSYSIIWDGTNDVFYSSAGRGLTAQGTAGPAVTDLWFDFAWD